METQRHLKQVLWCAGVTLAFALALLFVDSAGAQNSKSPQDSLGIMAGTATGDVVFHNMNTTSVTSGAYLQVATLANRASSVDIYESSSSVFYFATGSSGAQANKFLIIPGGDRIHFEMPAATKVWVKAASTGAAPSGIMIMNFFGQ